MITDILQGNPIVPVVVVDSPEQGVAVGRALVAGGIRTAEVTFRTAAAAQAIAAMSQIDGLTVGAGTVINPAQVDEAVTAGARYIVSPGFFPPVVKAAQDAGVGVLPACTDGSWIMAALDLGVRVVKFFPAGVMGGPAAIRALSAPFPQVGFVPTGGVNAANLGDYLGLPCVPAVGGTWMVKPALIREEKWDEVTALSAEAIRLAEEISTRR